MTTLNHAPDDRFRRDPRDWDRFKWGYIAHFAQGLLVCAGLGFLALPVLAWFYLEYQKTEYRRFRDVRDIYLRFAEQGKDGDDTKNWIVGDWISRDIGDWLYGGYVGALAGIAWQLALLVLVV